MPKSKPNPTRKPAKPSAQPRLNVGVPRKTRPVGRARMNLMVDRTVLARAAATAGTTNMSEVVNIALTRMAEDDAIIAGIDAAFGSIPDFPLDDGP